LYSPVVVPFFLQALGSTFFLYRSRWPFPIQCSLLHLATLLSWFQVLAQQPVLLQRSTTWMKESLYKPKLARDPCVHPQTSPLPLHSLLPVKSHQQMKLLPMSIQNTSNLTARRRTQSQLNFHTLSPSSFPLPILASRNPDYRLCPVSVQTIRSLSICSINVVCGLRIKLFSYPIPFLGDIPPGTSSSPSIRRCSARDTS
jgi:hypothetical protein